MKVTRRRKSVFPLMFLLVATTMAVGLFFVNYKTREIYGFPGKSVSSFSALKTGLVLLQGRDVMLYVAPSNGLREEKVQVEPDQSVQQLCATLEQRNLVALR